MDTCKIIGLNTKWYRYQLNITPNMLAELSSIPSTNIKDLINNIINNPSTVIIYKICKTLNLSLKDFFNSEYFDEDFDD